MKSVFCCLVSFLLAVCITPQARSASNPDHIDPCALIEKEKVMAAFPTVKAMEKQTIGPNTTCNYLNDRGFSALIISVHKYDGISPHVMMENLGNGYHVEDVDGLGDEAAMAITLAKPKYGIEGGGVAELYIRKGETTLLIAPVRVKVKAEGEGLGRLKALTREMTAQLP